MNRKQLLISACVIVGLAVLAGCKDEDGRSTTKPSYHLDPRTELCFATNGGHRMAHVPCTDKVKKLIRE